MLPSTLVRWSLPVGVAVLFLSADLRAQERHFPLDHRAPTGVAGRWSALIQPGAAEQPQPVLVRLPSTGQVTFYSGSTGNPLPPSEPTVVAMQVGYVYRFKISGLPEFPGIELYPSVEILDRLHPPAGLAQEFPVPIEITPEEIEIALQERLVTKVIYLEQPDIAPPEDQGPRTRVSDLPPTENLLKAADLRGRPLAILRLGGRVPDSRSPLEHFISRAPLTISTPPKE